MINIIFVQIYFHYFPNYIFIKVSALINLLPKNDNNFFLFYTHVKLYLNNFIIYTNSVEFVYYALRVELSYLIFYIETAFMNVICFFWILNKGINNNIYIFHNQKYYFLQFFPFLQLTFINARFCFTSLLNIT